MTTKPSVRAGRPTREQAEARHRQLLDSALDHFLEQGYERATIDAIAASVNMTKRTVYARYPDKEALFLAAVQRAIDHGAVSSERIRTLESGDLEETLTRFARMRIETVMTPHGLKLQRIINTESYRFPVILSMFYEKGTMPVIIALADIFRRETQGGHLALEDPMLAANVFISMVVSGPVRAFVAGNSMSREEVDRRIRFAVRLFLNGARRR